jgi:UDP-4-amino-4,6-dideoxy-N-acetyl-beta-L-altrosamine transaminase
VRNEIIPYGKQEVTGEDVESVLNALHSEFLTQGPKVKEFEDRFAEYVGAPYAVAVSNATAALHLCSLIQGVGPGKKVITTPNTFVATANSVLQAGGDILFADIDPASYCIDPNQVEDIIRRNPRGIVGIIPVDFAGHPAQMKDLREIADRYGLWITSDACHAPGAKYSDSESIYSVGCGVHAELTTFSFHPVKHIASGEGGMITTRNKDLYQKLLLMRSHGITKDRSQMADYDGPWDYEMQVLGYNYRIPDILCALGTSQLARAKENLLKRRRIAERYQEALSDLPIALPVELSSVNHAFHLYVIRTRDRDNLFNFLRERSIYAQVHYIPIHQQPYYIDRYGRQSFPKAESYYQQCLSLPMFPSLSGAEQERVIEVISDFFANKSESELSL